MVNVTEDYNNEVWDSKILLIQTQQKLLIQQEKKLTEKIDKLHRDVEIYLD